jgi:hypothetical protein
MLNLTRLAPLAGLVVLLWSSAVTGQSQSNSQQQYLLVKTVIEGLTRRSADQGDGNRVDFTQIENYDLYQCESGASFIGAWASNEEIIPQLANLAFDVLSWTGDLRGLKYPPDLWEQQLREYEKSQLAEMRRSRDGQSDSRIHNRKLTFMKQIKTRLGAYQKLHPSLAKINDTGSCRFIVRSGEVPINIETDPAGAKVLLIPSFFYELCRAQNIDPDDTVRCRRWREALNGRVSQVSGDYLYVVQWSDGATRKGKLSVMDARGDTLVLRKQ